ncbi:hypothetical protein MRBBS_0076 [Marinobacter sp. BSs20148]|nr:hypothetical protein MRBBS_0076 [Marinobacter sp. BSs20148]
MFLVIPLQCSLSFLCHGFVFSGVNLGWSEAVQFRYAIFASSDR